MALSVGLFGAGRSRKPLFANTVSTYVGAHGSWIWAAAAVLAALLALVMLRWLAALLLSTDRAGDLDDPRTAASSAAEPRGAGVVKPAAVNKAVVAEIETYRGVASAKSRTLGDADEPTARADRHRRQGREPRLRASAGRDRRGRPRPPGP